MTLAVDDGTAEAAEPNTGGCTMFWFRLIFCSLMLSLAATAVSANPAEWRFEGWDKTDFTRGRIAWSEIMSGGPPKDGIPSIDQPVFRSVAEAADLAPNDPVVGLEISGDARAYPLRVLIWHEIVNDRVGGLPVTVTYCPLCNSAVVFDRRLSGRILDFGTTGKLRNSDLVMYDRQTQSWWQQFTGEAIVGELTGSSLTLVPARLESFADFKSRHPDGKVLVPNNPNFRNYGRNPYVGYDSSAVPFLYRGDLPQGIEPMARVVVVRNDRAKPVIVTLDALRKRGQLTIGNVEFTWKAGQSSAVDSENIAEGRDVGTVEVFGHVPAESPKALPYDVTFAFVANAFHPDIKIMAE